MLKNLRVLVFSLYERPHLRNWFYTLAFGIFVPVGFRFALLAWKHGGDFDRVMTVIAGAAVGITALVTLLRIWAVPPSKTVVQVENCEPDLPDVHSTPSPYEFMDAVKGYSARNRQIAMGARALGSTRAFHHH